MAGLRGAFDSAVARHLSAMGRLHAARAVMDAAVDVGPSPADLAAERALAERLAAAAAGLRGQPGYVRLGEARLHETSFPVYVPFVGAAHLALSADSADPRVAALIRSVLLQTLATEPPGGVEVLAVDPATVGAVFAPLQPLVDARLMTSPATDGPGLDRVLTAAEEHVRAGLRGEKSTKLILALASAPDRSQRQLERLAALARSGVGVGLHIVAGGVGELPQAAPIAVGEHLKVGNPPNAPFGVRDGLAAPVTCDPPLETDYLRAESVRIAELAKTAAQLHFSDLAPDELWRENPAEGLVTVAGRDAQGVVRLSFDDATPHWLVGGRTGGGKTVFLLDILYGLAARYSPRDLALYLLDFKEGVSFTEFTPQPSDPSFIPHARAVGVESDREYGVAILRELDAEMTRRSTVMKRRGVARYSQLGSAEHMPRIVCVVDEFQVLFAGNDKLAREAVALLENLARKGRSYGVHLVLASQTTAGIEALYAKRESIFGQFPLRVALPGATSVLDVQNTAAQNLRTGEAVVNADGGIAGRDRKIRFPDAHAETETLHRLRHDMWQSFPDARPPTVFYGYAAVHLEDDARYAELAPTPRP
ncbi:MAG: FtsK/SpoIIIE domain-containing protein, partial [Stackebrandtia sp.]